MRQDSITPNYKCSNLRFCFFLLFSSSRPSSLRPRVPDVVHLRVLLHERVQLFVRGVLPSKWDGVRAPGQTGRVHLPGGALHHHHLTSVPAVEKYALIHRKIS